MSDEQSFERLRAQVEEWVEGPGERWAERIEETGEVPEALWAELNELGFLRMAAPVAYGGHGLPFSRWMELMEVF
ncbi:acyl-CoA dehydrogenase family protein, partial [Streptomyces sp. SID11233]|nr:acyl-CoA dehydrogenase family protein [Streptomyces sp. SID11233]